MLKGFNFRYKSTTIIKGFLQHKIQNTLKHQIKRWNQNFNCQEIILTNRNVKIYRYLRFELGQVLVKGSVFD